jgi:hypothetical protein
VVPGGCAHHLQLGDGVLTMKRLLHPQLATDKQYRDPVKQQLIPLVKRVRTDRNTFRETMLRWVRLCTCVRDQQAYQGRSQTFIPETKKIVDSWTRRIVRDLFPTDNWFDIQAVRAAYEPRVKAQQALFMYFFQKHARVKANATPWVRQLVMLGTSPLRVVWKHTTRSVEYLDEMFDPMTGAPTGELEMKQEDVTDFIGPTFTPVDLFAWYVFPYTVPDVNSAELVFQDLLVSRDRLRGLSATYIDPDDHDLGTVYEPKAVQRVFDRFSASGKARDKFDAEARRLSDKGFTHQLDMKMNPELWPADVTECTWVKDLEDAGKPQRYLVALGADEEILRIQKCPFIHNRSHWLAGRMFVHVDEFYGHGIPELIDRLNYTLIDTADQANDALTWSMNPIALVDIFGVQDPTSLRMRPGAKWLVQKGSVLFQEPPKESATTGFAAMGQYRSLIHELADVVPVGAPQQRSRGKAGQSAAGAQMMLSEAQIDIKEVVETNERVMVEFLEMTQSLTQQFLDREMILQIAGADGVTMVEQPVSVKDTVGDFNYEWLGSVQTQNLQVRAQQMVNYLGLVTKIPPQLLAQQNIDVDYKYILREIWGTGMGLRNPERVVKDKVKQLSVDPRIENDLFQLGRASEVTISQSDNHQEHVAIHNALLQSGDVSDPEEVKALFAHIRGHVAAQVAQQMQQAQQEAQKQGLLNAGAPQRQAQAQGAQNALQSRLAPPAGPGRMAQTGGLDDLFRQMPRGS